MCNEKFTYNEKDQTQSFSLYVNFFIQFGEFHKTDMLIFCVVVCEELCQFRSAEQAT